MSMASGGEQTLGKIMFYRQLEPLSAEKHGKLGVSSVSNPFSFLAETHLVPLTVDEFGLAAVCYPIIFDTQSKTPLAVMGLRPGMNVFLGADGSLDPEVYLPAFARRYPFLPIIAPEKVKNSKNEDDDRVVVCIDPRPRCFQPRRKCRSSKATSLRASRKRRSSSAASSIIWAAARRNSCN
jgi:hypothetical protein